MEYSDYQEEKPVPDWNDIDYLKGLIWDNEIFLDCCPYDQPQQRIKARRLINMAKARIDRLKKLNNGS